MGIYLSTRGNQKEDARSGRQPDENYAREVMQLFTIPCQMLTAPLMEVYFFGVEMSRPFPEAKNPLSEMMGAMGGEEGAKKEAGADRDGPPGKEGGKGGDGDPWPWSPGPGLGLGVPEASGPRRGRHDEEPEEAWSGRRHE